MRKGILMAKRTSLRKCKTGPLTVHHLYVKNIDDRLKEAEDAIVSLIEIWNYRAPDVDKRLKGLEKDIDRLILRH